MKIASRKSVIALHTATSGKRSAGNGHWTKIAANIKKSRDKSFIEKNKDGKVVNRTNGIASVGSAALDNEECWLYQKFLRSLGLIYIEHQARI